MMYWFTRAKNADRKLKLITITIEDGGNGNTANFRLIRRKKSYWRRPQIDAMEKELDITCRIGIKNTAISVHARWQNGQNTRKYISIDKKPSRLENLGLWIQRWCQKVEWKVTNSHFCACAVEIWYKIVSNAGNHHNFSSFPYGM